MEKKKKVRQIINGKLNTEEIQHLRRSGFPIPNKTKLPLTSKRPLRRFAAWWETTTVEKFLEDIVFLLKNAALLDIINLVAGVTIIISLGTWWTGRKESLEDDKISAFLTWAEINESGKHPEIAKLALQRLVEKDISLKKLDLQEADLWDADLQEADLMDANLQKADLMGANLQKADLWAANLQKAVLMDADLQEARLIRANLQKADLGGAKLQKAVLGDAKLQKAVLVDVNLQEADLMRANLQEADLRDANLQEARLWNANLQEARLMRANLQEADLGGAENLTHQQIKSACNWEKGIYKAKWNYEKQEQLRETIEPDNTNFIEELKKDKSSDPKEAPDCSIWDNKE